MQRLSISRKPQLLVVLTASSWYEGARAVYRHARLRPVICWVDPSWGIWIKSWTMRSAMPPTDQVIGLYGTDVALNEIEDDVLHHLQLLTKATE